MMIGSIGRVLNVVKGLDSLNVIMIKITDKVPNDVKDLDSLNTMTSLEARVHQCVSDAHNVNQETTISEPTTTS